MVDEHRHARAGRLERDVALHVVVGRDEREAVAHAVARVRHLPRLHRAVRRPVARAARPRERERARDPRAARRVRELETRALRLEVDGPLARLETRVRPRRAGGEAAA